MSDNMRTNCKKNFKTPNIIFNTCCIEAYFASSPYVMSVYGDDLLKKFTSSVETVPYGFLTRKNPPIESWRFFSYIFESKLWVALVLAFVLLNTTVVLLKILLSKLFEIDKNVVGAKFQCELSFSILWMIFQISVTLGKTFLSLGIQSVPSSNSERLILICCLWFGLVISTLFNT